MPNISYVHDVHTLCGIDDAHLYGNKRKQNQATTDYVLQTEIITTDEDDNVFGEDS